MSAKRQRADIIKLVEDSSAVLLARSLEHQKCFQAAHSLGNILAAVSLRLYDQALLLGDKSLTFRDLLFCLGEVSQKNFPVHALRLPRVAIRQAASGFLVLAQRRSRQRRSSSSFTAEL
jgi:hypothetical protein